MMRENAQSPTTVRLSATDAFFVAYQRASGVLMQLGGEADVEGKVTRDDLELMIRNLVNRWPQLGQKLRKGFVGLYWAGECRYREILTIGNGRNDEAARWRNTPLDPFREPPFQVLWVPCIGGGTLALRAHHSVMDGESFFTVGTEAVRFLARIQAGQSDQNSPASYKASPRPAKVLLRKRLTFKKLRSASLYARWLGAEARAARSARLAMDACAPGDTSSHVETINQNDFAQLKLRAVEAGVTPTAWCAAAWIRAIHSWNVSRGAPGNPLVSLEVPVSLRRVKNANLDTVGNFISPLLVFSDATNPIEQIAQNIKKQLTAAMRAHAHLSMPLLSAPAKFLPWALFRRVAVNPKTTGFATSHFTWFEPETDLPAEVRKLSDGKLRLTGERIYTPVCLHMGAALAVVVFPERVQFFLTYREHALSSDSAGELMNLLMAELESRGALENFKTATR
ncbi:MAG TPA: hypothetical protein VNO50_21930 [Pyrinomonadaceae bacterium]|nr:hypothetical protein [Pyrinomonadaceae bacterium]